MDTVKSGKKGKSKVRKAKQKAKKAMGQTNAEAPWGGLSSQGGFSEVKVKNMGGQADVEVNRLRYETTSAFTATGGAASYLQVKANSVYRPYPGNTDSCGGYQRMYTQYRQSYAAGSTLEVRVWSATGTASQEPFRIVVVPCTSDQYTIYSAYTNIASLVDVPHAKEVLFSPGGVLPHLSSKCSVANISMGEKKERGLADVVSTSDFWGASGADPSRLVYWLVGLQCMAGTTTLNCQIQVRITYNMKWRQPIATAVQQLTRFGTEFTSADNKRTVAESVEAVDRVKDEEEAVRQQIRRDVLLRVKTFNEKKAEEVKAEPTDKQDLDPDEEGLYLALAKFYQQRQKSAPPTALKGGQAEEKPGLSLS